MKALRGHSFFSTIGWKDLWTVPAPPVEAGLVKKDPRAAEGRWDDVGAVWDELVDSGRDEDEMSWASDEDHTEEIKFVEIPTTLGQQNGRPEEVGPMGETRPTYVLAPSIPVGTAETNGRQTPRPLSMKNGVNGQSQTGSGSSSGVRFVEEEEQISPEESSQPLPISRQTSESDRTDSGAEADEDRDTVAPTLDDIPSAVKTQPIDVPLVTSGLRDSFSTGSATSSSDGSPPSAALDAALAMARGRDRTQTPIQGSRPANHDEEW